MSTVIPLRPNVAHTGSPISPKWFEYPGSVLALSGAFLVAARIDISGWGFVLFLLSSLTLSAHAIRIRSWGLLAMQLGFTLTNAIGVWRWLLH